MPTPTGYSRIQIRLHWIVAVLIVFQYVFHEGIADAWEVYQKGGTVEFSPLIASHVAGGGAILLLVIWRLVVRLRRGAPPPPEQEHPLLKLAAHATHFILYALMVLMPVSGAVAWFGGVDNAAEAHEVMKVLLLALIVLHFLAALFHQFILKTGLMKRMRTPS